MTNKIRYFIANWKMYGDLASLKSIKNVIKFSRFSISKKFKIIYCPPYTLLSDFVDTLKKSSIETGAQNIHENYDFGAHTGFINSKMLKNLGVKYVIIGHSENRTLGEDHKQINKKILSAIKSKLNVIFCIGETSFQRKNKKTNIILKKQIMNGLKGIGKKCKIIVAYEPVWSIGTGVVPNNLELEKNIKFIKSIISKKFKNYKILYGGSVSPNNIQKLNMIDLLDGYLIGGASQSSKKLIDIIQKTFN